MRTRDVRPREPRLTHDFTQINTRPEYERTLPSERSYLIMDCTARYLYTWIITPYVPWHVFCPVLDSDGNPHFELFRPTNSLRRVMQICRWVKSLRSCKSLAWFQCATYLIWRRCRKTFDPPSTCDRSPPPAIARLHLRSLPSTCDRSPPRAIAPLHLRSRPSTWECSAPSESAPHQWDRSPHLRPLPSTCDRFPPPETAKGSKAEGRVAKRRRG